jgi:hypothetical protein
VESGVGYVRKNFWPRVDDYEAVIDLVDRSRCWLDETANVRVHGTSVRLRRLRRGIGMFVHDGPDAQRRADVLNPIRNREANLAYGP